MTADARLAAMPALSAEHYQLLGEVVAAGAMLETATEGAICQLVEPGRQLNAVLKLTQGQPVSWMLDKVRVLVAETIEEADRARWHEWLGRAKRAVEERNSIVHVAWLLGLNQQHALGLRRTRRGSSARAGTTEEFAAIRDRLLVCHRELIQLINDLSRARDPAE